MNANAITPFEFQARRQRLAANLPDNCLVILPAAHEVIRNNDAEYPFRQQSDFWYLTGFNEPDAWMTLKKQAGQLQFCLFVRPKNKVDEIWTGYRAGPEGAIQQHQADHAFTLADLTEQLLAQISDVDVVVLPFNQPRAQEQAQACLDKLANQRRQGQGAPGHLLDLNAPLHELRLIKSAAEIELLRTAGRISAQAHIRAMRACRHSDNEAQLEAEILYQFMRSGARFAAYNSIVGAGANACVLHYISNDQPLKSGDLVLIDAGAEYRNYAGDITRTFPVNGQFSAPQADLYDLVLAAQTAAIAQLREGLGAKDFHQSAVRVLTQGMVDLGLLRGSVDGLIESNAYKKYYMHGTGHWLGLDVHDVGAYKQGSDWRPLAAGMVTTVEPGIYISPDDEDAPKALRGLGIRIEDDLVITQGEPDNLSADAPKLRTEIEALMRD